MLPARALPLRSPAAGESLCSADDELRKASWKLPFAVKWLLPECFLPLSPPRQQGITGIPWLGLRPSAEGGTGSLLILCNVCLTYAVTAEPRAEQYTHGILLAVSIFEM